MPNDITLIQVRPALQKKSGPRFHASRFLSFAKETETIYLPVFTYCMQSP